ncbi:hypothetical protein [Pseudomonas syringae]|nr:hypothetical protein [Pseudomonas syringae]
MPSCNAARPTPCHAHLGWRARRSLDCMLTDAWRWQCSIKDEQIETQAG